MTSDLTAYFNDTGLLTKNILFGQESGSISGLQEQGPAATKADSRYRTAQKAKAEKTSIFLKAINDIRDYITRLEQEIEALEEQFRKNHGDEWREKLALKILGADDIPPRRKDETMKDYRERLEPILMSELLNEDGSIKEKYKNDPELSDYAQWAQKQYHLNTAQGYVRELENPYTSPDRKDEILEELEQRSDYEELYLVDHQANVQGDVQYQIKANTDKIEDDLTQTQLSLGVGSKFTS